MFDIIEENNEVTIKTKNKDFAILVNNDFVSIFKLNKNTGEYEEIQVFENWQNDNNKKCYIINK